MELEILITDDGSPTIYDTELNETYHSRFGAVAESAHVFIENGLHNWLAQTKNTHADILEVGLGTGLNAVLSGIYQNSYGISVYYKAIEPFPLPMNIVHRLDFRPTIGNSLAVQYFDRIHHEAFAKTIQLAPNFSFQKQKVAFESLADDNAFDIIYYDAFAPNKQPEMWEAPNMRKAYHLTRRAGLLVTYCAKGAVKRSLADAGFKIVTVPGPPGKREMIQAWKV